MLRTWLMLPINCINESYYWLLGIYRMPLRFATLVFAILRKPGRSGNDLLEYSWCVLLIQSLSDQVNCAFHFTAFLGSISKLDEDLCSRTNNFEFFSSRRSWITDVINGSTWSSNEYLCALCFFLSAASPEWMQEAPRDGKQIWWMWPSVSASMALI